MSRVLPCLLCGVEDRDVAVGLVEIPEGERRVVAVSLPVVHREGAVEMNRDVREIYAAMPRCRDTRACAERVRAITAPEPVPPVVVEPEPEPVGWVL